MGDKPKPIQIKGIKEGLLVSLGDGEWQGLIHSLLDYIKENESFFTGAKLALDVGSTNIYAAELGWLRDKLSENNIGLWAVITQSPTTEKTALMLGLDTRLSSPKPDRNIKSLDTSVGGESAILVHRTLRSGNTINYGLHVVVFGDVNPGAEIIAGGNVIVWGKLRGEVHAGFEGNDKAVICALDVDSLQLRIANITNIVPKIKNFHKPAIAYVKNDNIEIAEWNNKEGVR
jgi:septum site-determining protein MinC